jgi:hypothetical protein
LTSKGTWSKLIPLLPVLLSFFPKEEMDCAMFNEIHRHFVLFKRSPNGSEITYRHITLVEREQFEVGVLDCQTMDVNTSVLAKAESAELQLCENLELGILEAEKEYKLSIKSGWRALDSTLTAYAALRGSRAVA